MIIKYEEKFKVDKKLCSYIDGTNFHPPYYQVELPVSSKYAGYFFKCSPYFLRECNNWNVISRGNTSHIFELIKLKREAGKRYTRPKLSFEQLAAEFKNEEEHLTYDNLPYALAEILIYANDKTRSAGEVIGKEFVVAHFDATWLYLSDTSRRNIKSNGVKIIRTLSNKEVDSARQKIARLQDLEVNVEKLTRYKLGLIPRQFDFDLKAYLSPKTCKTVTDLLTKIRDTILEELTNYQNEVAEIKKHLNI